MQINPRILKHYLKNVHFITGTAYAGKSTMVKMLAEEYGMICCGENYDCIPEGILNPEQYPNLSYFQTMPSWQAFVNRPPEVYEQWIYGNQEELAEFEILYLLRISKEQKVIVDTNIPIPVLREIADYHQVAVMLCPQAMSVAHFFDRDDPEKAFLREHILQADDPAKTMENFLAGIARINSQEHYGEMAGSGFFTLIREDTATDTRRKTLKTLADHFGLTNGAKGEPSI